MGHFAFWILHIVAVLFGFVFLFLTIPLHIIYGVVRRNSNEASSDRRELEALWREKKDGEFAEKHHGRGRGLPRKRCAD